MSTVQPGEISVEVVYAEPAEQALVSVTLPAGATVADAIARSGLAARFAAADLQSLATGVWGHPVQRDHLLRDGDRVELYRPLLMDPRDARRKLAEHGRAMGQKPAGAKRSD